MPPERQKVFLLLLLITVIVHRKVKEREAIYELDDGNAPALLHDGPYPWGPLHASETLNPTPLLHLKAYAVNKTSPAFLFFSFGFMCTYWPCLCDSFLYG